MYSQTSTHIHAQKSPVRKKKLGCDLYGILVANVTDVIFISLLYSKIEYRAKPSRRSAERDENKPELSNAHDKVVEMMKNQFQNE